MSVNPQKMYALKRRLSKAEIMPETYTGQEKKVFGENKQKEKIEEAIANAQIIRGIITQVDRNKAYVDWEGFRGIIPKDQLDEKSLKGLIGFVGRPCVFVIKGYDQDEKLFVASRTEALEMMKTTTLEELKVGNIQAGTVVKVEQWGCIMDLGGVLGRLSISDMLHTFVSDAREVVQKGDYFDVVIKKVSRNENGENRVTLSLKDLIPVPWDRVTDRYKVNDFCLGHVSGFLDDEKVFVKLEEGVEGLADIPQGMQLAIEQRLKVRVAKINTERQRIKLKIVGVVG